MRAMPSRRGECEASQRLRSHSRGLRHAIESTLDVTKAWPLQSLAAAAGHRAAQVPSAANALPFFCNAASATP